MENYDPRIIIFGPSGAGKTVLAATALDVPELNPVLYLDIENQTRSIRSKLNPIDIGELGKKTKDGLMDWVRLKSWQDIDSAYQYIFDRKAKDVKSSYRCVISDSLTDINFLSLDQAVGVTCRTKLSDVKAPQIQDYGKAHWMLRQMLRAFRDLDGIAVIATALPKDQEAIDSSIQMLKPALTGQMSEIACSMSDLVGYLSVDSNGVRRIQFQQRGRIYAKWRSEGPPVKEVENPTIQKIVNLLQT